MTGDRGTHDGVPPPRLRRRGLGFAVVIAVMMAASVAVQMAREARFASVASEASLLYVRSGPTLTRLALSFDDLLADVYWIRAIQHYGSTKRADAGEKSYALLYPLLDLTTTLDPRFNIAYRFGAIFLTEAYPDGPGQPEQAIALLEKGVAAMPNRWQYVLDIGFVHYWWRQDYGAAAEWFERASQVEGAPQWLGPLAATTFAQGGQRAGSRLLWQQLLETGDNEWLQNEAARRLLQLDAMDGLDQLRPAITAYRERTGQWPGDWDDLVGAGLLPGVPVDPTGTPYRLRPGTGEVDVGADSVLHPLPTEPNRLFGAAS